MAPCAAIEKSKGGRGFASGTPHSHANLEGSSGLAFPVTRMSDWRSGVMEEVSPQWTAQTVGRHPMRCLRNSLKDWMRGKRFNIHFLATSIDFKVTKQVSSSFAATTTGFSMTSHRLF